jgi:hypothetical protein
VESHREVLEAISSRKVELIEKSVGTAGRYLSNHEK